MSMTQLEAVFENGVFRPLQPVRLPENQRVTVTVDDPTDPADFANRTQFVLSEERWQQFCEALDAPAKEIPALKKLLTESSVFDESRDASS
jgi:predicted DNA-binding antitoxin AbrB/MazE fold protein